MDKLKEVLGTYFVDTFVNSIFLAAKQQHRPGDSLEKEYLESVRRYVLEVRSKERALRKVVNNLLEFVGRLKLPERTWPLLVSKVNQSLVPRQYYDRLSAKQSEEIFANLITTLVVNLGVRCTQPDTAAAILDRKDRGRLGQVVADLQDYALALITGEQTRLYNQFLGVSTGAQDSKTTETLISLQNAIRAMAEEKVKMTHQIRALEDQLERERLRVQKVRNRSAALENKLYEVLAAQRIVVAGGAGGAAAGAASAPGGAAPAPGGAGGAGGGSLASLVKGAADDSSSAGGGQSDDEADLAELPLALDAAPEAAEVAPAAPRQFTGF